MSEDSKIYLAEKVDPETAAKLDYAEIGYTLTGPPLTDSEVEGQAMMRKFVQCPWCAKMNMLVYDPQRWQYFRCSHCGHIFSFFI